MLYLVCGPAGSGKDTFCDYLVENHIFRKEAFADSLKKDVSKKTNIPLYFFYDRDLKDSKFNFYVIFFNISYQEFSVIFLFFFLLFIFSSILFCLVLFFTFIKLYDFYSDTYCGKTPRNILIEYANRKRDKDSLYFVKKVDVNSNENICISDCRFKNEIEFFKGNENYKVKSIWIERGNIEKIFDNAEISAKNCDIILYNNKNPFDGNDMYQQLKTYI